MPTVTIVVDTVTASPRPFDIIDSFTREHGLVTSEMVPAMRALSEDGRRGACG